MYGGLGGIRFAGRQQELLVLSEAVVGDQDRARLINLTGEAGIGKSRLLTEVLAATPVPSDATVIACTAAEEQYGPFETLTSVLGPPITGDAGAPERWLAPLSALAGHQKLVLMVDDLHHPTYAINTMIAQLLRRPPRTNLVLVFAHRPRRGASRLLAALGSTQHQWQTDHIKLGPLSRDAMEQLYPADLCVQHHLTVSQASGGNPRYLELLMALCQGDGCRGESILANGAELPVEAAAPIRMELDELSPSARLVGQAAAVVGDSFDLELTALVAQLDRPVVLVAIDELLAVDLVQPDGPPGCFRFRHPVLRGVAYRSAPQGWRLGAHGRAAEAMHSRNDPAIRLAEHVDRAGQADDPNGIAVLIEAGQASELTAPGTAAGWYRSALRLLGDHPEHREQRLDVLLALARGALLTGQFDDCQQALLRREELLSGCADSSDNVSEAVECRAALAQHAGRYTEARAMLHSTIASRDHNSDSTRLRLALARTTVWETGWEWSEDALLGATGSGDPVLQTLALGIHAMAALAKGAPDVARRSVSEASRLVERQADDQLARSLGAVCFLGWAETHLEHHLQAIRHFTRCLAISRSHDQRPMMVPPLVGLGTVNLRLGRLDRAQELAEQAVRLARSPGYEDLLAMALTLRAQVALLRGDIDSSMADSRTAGEAVTSDSPWWRQAGLVRAAALLVTGAAAACLETVLDVGGGTHLVELPTWDHPMAYDLMSQAELAIGRADQARVWADRAHAAAKELGLPGQLCLADLALSKVATGPADALAYALKAIDNGTSSEHPLEVGRAHLRASEALLALAEYGRAGEHLDAVEAIGNPCAAAALLQAGRDLRARIGTERGAQSEQYVLSQRELEISHLISQGRTNRQIARQLEVSHKTVETHLGRIFAKLNVCSRAEIANLVGRDSVVARPRRTAAARQVSV